MIEIYWDSSYLISIKELRMHMCMNLQYLYTTNLSKVYKNMDISFSSPICPSQ